MEQLQLEVQVSSKETKIKQLSAQLKLIKDSLDLEQRRNIERGLGQLSRNEQLENSLKLLEYENKQLEGKLLESVSELTMQRQGRRSELREIGELREQNGELKRQRTRGQMEVSELRDQLSSLKEEFVLDRSRKETELSELAGKDEEIEELRREMGVLREEVKGIAAYTSSLEEEFQKYQIKTQKFIRWIIKVIESDNVIEEREVVELSVEEMQIEFQEAVVRKNEKIEKKRRFL